jgi:uncharacterized FlaG/YvyC family protein
MRAKVVAFGLLALFAGGLPAHAENLYDAKVAQKLSDLTDDQKAKVSTITKQTATEMNAVFKKYGIDPEAKPDFDKLQKAGEELQAVARREKAQMKDILSKAQFKQYVKIIDATGARVRKAAN